MKWIIPGLLFAAAVGIFFWARRMANKPVEFGKVRFIPYTALMFLAAVGIVVLAAYATSLLKGP